MAEGKWTVRWESDYPGGWAWAVIDPDGSIAAVERNWDDAMYWARVWAEEDRVEAVVAEAGRGWAE